jgi:hypothetical protein
VLSEKLLKLLKPSSMPNLKHQLTSQVMNWLTLNNLNPDYF